MSSHLPPFTSRSIDRMRTLRSILCVGLDPQLEMMPPHLVHQFLSGTSPNDWQAIANLFLAFNKAIIDAIHESAVWVKPNIAFYECYGSEGIRAYEETIAYAKTKNLLIICDGKRGDGGDTARVYAEGHIGLVSSWDESSSAFTKIPGPLHVDALTVETTIGDAGVRAYLDAANQNGTGVIIVTKSSFKPNSPIEQIETATHTKVWEEIAAMVRNWGDSGVIEDGWSNVWAVVGATFPTEALRARELMPNTWFLVPGFGTQGGGADEAVVAADMNGFGVAVNSARGIIFTQQKGPFATTSEAFAQAASNAALHARDELNAALKRAGKGAGIFWNT